VDYNSSHPPKERFAMSSDAVVNVSAPVPAANGLSQVERVVDAFVAPTKTFKDILRNTSWWLPAVLIALSIWAAGFVTDRQVGFDRVYETALSQSPRQEDRINQLPPDQKANAVALGAKITKVITYSVPVVLLAANAIYALMLWGSFNFGFGAKTTFLQAYAVAWYAALPFLVRSLLTIVFLYAGGNTDAFDQKNPVGTNLAYYMPDAAPMVRAILAPFDLIALWSLVLVTIGMAIVAKKPVMQAAIVTVGFWLLGVLAGVAGAAVS